MSAPGNRRRGSRLHHAAVYFGLAEPDLTVAPQPPEAQRRRYLQGFTFVVLLGVGVALALRRSIEEALWWGLACQLAWWAEVAIHNDGRLRRLRPKLAEFSSDLLFRVPVLFGLWAALWADRSLWGAAVFSLLLGVTTAVLEASGPEDVGDAAGEDRRDHG